MTLQKKVLVVDDDEDILEALQLTFDVAGYNTETITKGEETYALVHTFKPDVIVLDVLLSGKDGRTICRNLKNDKRTKHIPILMISAHPSAAKSTLEVGADAFLSKPFDIDDLLDQVKKLV